MSRASSDFSPSRQQATLTTLFKKRQEAFFASLQRFLEAVASDEYIQQMFEDQNSANYVPNRICELVTIILRDDRERFLMSVLGRLSSIEACFGPQRAKKLEEIGSKLIELSSQQNRKEAEQRNAIKALREQLSSLQEELVTKYGARANEVNYLSQIKTNAQDVRTISDELKQSMKAFNSVMKTNFSLARKKATRILTSLIDHYESMGPSQAEVEQMKNKYDKKINKSSKKLQQASDLINQKQADIQQLEEEIKLIKRQTKASLKEKNDSNENLQRQLEEMKSDLRKSDMEAENLSQRLTDLQRVNQTAQSELQTSQKRYSQAKDTISSLKDNVQQLEMTRSQQKKENDELRKMNNEMNLENQKLAQNIRESEKSNKKLQATLNYNQQQFQQQLSEVSAERNDLQKSLRDSQKINQQLKDLQTETQSKLQVQSNQINQLQNQLEKEEREYSKLKNQAQSEIALRDDKIDQLTSENKKIHKKLNDLSNEIETSNIAISERNTTIEQYKDQISNLTRQIKQNDKQFQLLISKEQNNNKIITQKLNDKISQLQQLSDDQSNTISQMQQENQELSRSNSNLQKSLSKEINGHQQTTYQNEQLSHIREELESQLDSYSQQVAQLTSNLESTNNKLQKEKQNNANARNEIQKNQTDIVNLKDKLKSAQNELKQQMQLYNDVTTEKDLKISQSKEENKKLNKANKLLSNDNSAKDNTIKTLNSQIEELQNKIKQHESTISDQNSQLQQSNEDHSDQIQMKDNTISQLTSQIQASQQNLKDSLTRLSKQKQDLKQNEKVIQDKNQVIDELNNERNELRASLKATTNELEQQQQVNKQQTDALRSSESANNDLQEELKKLMDEKNVLNLQIESINKEKSDMKKEISRSNKVISKLQSQIDSLTDEIHQSQNKILACENDINGKEETIRLQKAEIEEDVRIINKLNEDKAEQQSSLSEAEQLILQLKNSLSDSKSKNQDLVHEKQEMTDFIQQKEEELNDMQNTAEQLRQNLNAMTRENKNLSREIEKKELEIDHLKETSKLSESQQTKKLNDAQNLIDEVTANCQVHSILDIPKLVQQLRKEIDDKDNTFSILRGTMQFRDDNEITEKAKKLSDDSNELNRLKRELDIEKVDSLPQTIKTLTKENQLFKGIQSQLLNELSIQNPEDLIANVVNLRDNCEHFAEITDSICQILNLETDDNVVEIVDQLLRDKKEFERRVANSVNNPTYNTNSKDEQEEPNNQLSLKLIAELKQAVSKNRNFLNRLVRLLQIDVNSITSSRANTSNNTSISLTENNEDDSISNAIYNSVSDLLSHIADMNNREEQLMITLAADSPDTILKRIDEQMHDLSKYAKLLETLANLTQADGSGIVDKVQEIINENNEMKNNEREICDQLKLNNMSKVSSKLRSLSQANSILSSLCQMLNLDSFVQIQPAVEALLESNDQYNELNGLFPDDLSYTNLDEKIANVIKENTSLKQQKAKVSELLNNDDIEKAVIELLQNLKDSSSLFSQLLGVLSSTPLKITFPLSKSIRDRLLSLVSEFKAKTEASQKQMDNIMNRAQTLGYNGSSVVEAVDYIAAAISESERQNYMEKMHNEMMDVRASSQKEQSFAEKQLEKAKKKNKELRQAVSATQEKAANREEEMLRELEDCKEELRKCLDELKKEKEIHEELLRVISGQSHDTEYLRSKLNEREFDLINKSEKNRKLLEQMAAKTQEQQQMINKHKKAREDAFSNFGNS